MNNSRIRLKFKGSYLKQEDKAPFTPKNVVNLLIVYELDTWSQELNTDFTLKDFSFGSVKLTKNADPDKHKYSFSNLRFDSRSEFSLPDRSMSKNAIIFGVDMSLSLHLDNKKKDILILGKGSTQGLNDAVLTGEAQYSINISRSNREFCLSLYYTGSNKFLFVYTTKYINSKQNVLK